VTALAVEDALLVVGAVEVITDDDGVALVTLISYLIYRRNCSYPTYKAKIMPRTYAF
jgi:hypothetical protein